MTARQTVLVVGGTGRTGGRVVRQLLSRGVAVRAIVRSTQKLPQDILADPNLTVIEAELLTLSDDDLRHHLSGCVAMISCLGHVISLRGIFGPPRDLVARATERLCLAARALAPAEPIRFALMSSVSVHRGRDLDPRRGSFERVFLSVLCALVPPANDNQRAADFLMTRIGPNDAHVEWSVVRPDALLDGEVTEYAVHESLVNSVFKPGSTNMANVAHFLCELATNPATWAAWKSKLPVIVNA